MSDGFDKLAGGIGEAIQTVPELYQDTLQPTTQETGKTLSLIPRTINAALVPLRQWIAEREYNLAETEKLLAKKLEHVGEDKIVTPEPYVAIPTIQAISYCKNSEELRDLYANLLAKAMNSDTKDLVHPSFVEIIKQMSPNDAYILKEIASRIPFPTVSIFSCKYLEPPSKTFSLSDPIEKHGYNNITDITTLHPDLVNISIDNLLRLRLIDKHTSFNKSVDENIEKTNFYINMVEKLQKYIVDSNWQYEQYIHFIYFSSFGHSFSKICLNNP